MPRPPRTPWSEAARLPASRPLELRPGEVPWRLRKVGNERADQAIERARRMPWWRLLRSKLPTWSGGWWCWPGVPMPSEPPIPRSHRARATPQTHHDADVASSRPAYGSR